MRAYEEMKKSSYAHDAVDFWNGHWYSYRSVMEFVDMLSGHFCFSDAE